MACPPQPQACNLGTTIWMCSNWTAASNTPVHLLTPWLYTKLERATHIVSNNEKFLHIYVQTGSPLIFFASLFPKMARVCQNFFVHLELSQSFYHKDVLMGHGMTELLLRPA